MACGLINSWVLIRNSSTDAAAHNFNVICRGVKSVVDGFPRGGTLSI